MTPQTDTAGPPIPVSSGPDGMIVTGGLLFVANNNSNDVTVVDTTDPDSLLYLINRYYDPATGQFTSLDPDIASTDQPYSYANDDPVGASDPRGLATLGVCIGFGGQLGAWRSGGVANAYASITRRIRRDESHLSTVVTSLFG